MMADFRESHAESREQEPCVDAAQPLVCCNAIANRKTSVLIVDEAQNLSFEVLEEIRLLH